MNDVNLLVDDLVFGEGPRWHDGKLWFSDMHGEKVHTVDMDGNLATVLELPGQRPSGLGFLADGSLLLTSMLEAKVYRLHDGDLTVHADLSAFAEGINDMVVDPQGRAYVGSFPKPPATGPIMLVEPDGSARVVADEMHFPNGMVITAEGTLVAAESLGKRLTEFDIEADGSLTNRRVWGEIAPYTPDGIALDAEGAIWAATTMSHAFVRFGRGGEVLQVVELGERFTIACALGGPDGRTLFMLSADTYAPDRHGVREGTLHTVTVDVPSA
ncbi:MAG: SMP-30/gluconolactonase/LRE family protein [Acidimicrobiia bacterium]